MPDTFFSQSAIHAPKVAFLLHNLTLFETILPLLTRLDEEKITYDLIVPEIETSDNWGNMSRDTYLYITKLGYRARFLNNNPQINYKIAFYPYLPYYFEVNSCYKVRYQYGMAKPEWNLDVWSAKFDLIFCNSIYDEAFLKGYTSTLLTGFLKYGNISENHQRKIHKKPYLLYLPTYGDESSINELADHLKNLRKDFHIVTKLHHGTSYLEADRKELAGSFSDEVYDHFTPLVELMREADVILSDSSGAIFEGLITKVPVVVFRWSLPLPFEGLPSLEELVIADELVKCVSNPTLLRNILLEASQGYDQSQLDKIKEIFPVIGNETLDICMSQIYKLLNDDIDIHKYSIHRRLVRYIEELEHSKERLHATLENNNQLKVDLEEKYKENSELYRDIKLKADSIIRIQEEFDRVRNELTTAYILKDELSLVSDNLVKERDGLLNETHELKTELVDLEKKFTARLASSQEAIHEKDIQLENLKEYNNRIEHELNNIYNSKRWKLINLMRDILNKFKGSLIGKVIQMWKKYGFVHVIKKIYFKLRRRTTHLNLNNLQQEGPFMLNWYQYKFLDFKSKFSDHGKVDLQQVKYLNETRGLVSIILPVYNGEDMIEEAVESILRQTYTHYELIIINDGSTDNTANILSKLSTKDNRIQVIHQENLKIPRTLSKGFYLAKGEFFTWTSADNNLHPNCIEKLVEELTHDETLGMVYANMRLIDENGNLLVNHGWYEEPEGSGHVILPSHTYELNTYPNNTIGAAFMYRAKAARILGDYSAYKHTLEDYDYWMRMNSLFTVKHVSFSEPIYDYRMHRRSLTAQDKELGITSNRYKLMVLDDFRRDLYLSPIVWVIKNHNSPLYNIIIEEINKLGHVIADFETIQQSNGYLNEATPMCQLELGPIEDKMLKCCPHAFHVAIDFSDSSKREFKMQMIEGTEEFVTDDPNSVISLVFNAAINKHSYTIESLIEKPHEYSYKLSVIICTYKRSEKLNQAIRSVIEQTLPPNDYEIIVVNNDPTCVDVKKIVFDLKQEFINNHFKYIVSPLKGLSFARNAGMISAKGEVLLYLDDDVIADKDLLRVTIECFEMDKEAGVIGGNIKLVKPNNSHSVILPGHEALWSQLLINNDYYYEVKDQWDFPYGANYAVRYDALMTIGGFRTSYGRKDNDFSGGEEHVVSFMMQQINKKVGLNPKACVLHDVDESRFSFEHVKKTIRASILTTYRLQKDLYAPMDSDIQYDKERIRELEHEYSLLDKKNTDGQYDLEMFYKSCYLEAMIELVQIKEVDEENRIIGFEKLLDGQK